MMPDLLAYFLTGQGRCERTQAITSQLYDRGRVAGTRRSYAGWTCLAAIMPELVDPGTIIGEIDESVA